MSCNFVTQKRWRKCGEDRSRWLKHFILVSGYMTMMTLVIVFIRWFQVDDSSWHFTSIFGYYATGVLLVITVEMFRSRLKKEESIHRYSEFSDWLFLILLFLTTLTGIMMHALRLAGWPMGTYVMYVIHLASRRADAGHRGPLWKMVPSFLQAAGHIFGDRQGEGLKGLQGRC